MSSRRAMVQMLAAAALAACDRRTSPAPGQVARATPVPMRFARTLSMAVRDGYHIVDIEASVVTWGGTAGGPRQRARLALVPREVEPPSLTGDLAGASLIRTPIRRLAVNDQPHEAMARALGVADLLVAVGGHASYDDSIRARVRAGRIHQVGYGWHQAPTLDALVAARPDAFLARMADLTHIRHMERVKALGIPVVPTFLDAEPHYLGRVEWVLLLGLLVGKQREAQSFVAEVIREVDRLKQRASTQPRRSLLWAWYQSSGDRWSVTRRNSDAALIRDANVELALGAPDDPELDVFSPLSTEQLLASATAADCWMIRDPLSSPFTNGSILDRFKAFRDGCVFWQPGGKSAGADSWELWEMGTIRPDWLLADIIKMAHPPLRDGSWRYLALETREGPNAGQGRH